MDSWGPTMTVNETNMRLWFAALRSGEFEQGPGYLKKTAPDGTSKHCCLGVACEIAMRHGVELSTHYVGESGGYGFIQFNGTGSELPLEVASWLGVISAVPKVGRNELGAVVSAVAANDSMGWDFGRIADQAEKYYFGGECR
jgi:hypothetical protein